MYMPVAETLASTGWTVGLTGGGLNAGLPTAHAAPSWFALRVKSRFEKVTSASLRGKGYEEFTPLYRRRTRSRGRLNETEFPLFPGYVFCRFASQHRLPIMMTPGVVHVVSAGRTPCPVSEAEIEAIRTVHRSFLEVQPHPFPKTGQRVSIDCGPLRGVHGIVLEQKDNYRLVVSITLLQRSVSVAIERSWIQCV